MTSFSVQESVAITGIGCRFPGGIHSPEKFWEFLLSGHDAIREMPDDRWGGDPLFDPDPRAAGRTYVRRGAFLDAVDGFDPELFGISPKEAASIDPQHRLLLETSWEALESAHLAPSSLRGDNVGVFVGIGQAQHAPAELYSGNLEGIGPYAGTGALLSFASGRIAHFLGVRGPSLSVDTACSSSLVALHLACVALERGECDMALAAGVHLHLSPHVTLSLSRTGVLAPDGQSKTFDESADGFGRGEGCGVLVLRRLSDALAAGDTVLGIVRGTAVNSDGASSGFTVPDASAQEQVIRTALKAARAKPEDIDYLETHGTGTRLGDPIEIEALGQVFGAGRHTPLALGAVKSSIGHLEAAAGMAGVIKALLVLQNQILPPQSGLKTLSPEVPWNSLPFIVPTEPTAPSSPMRMAGVSSFGMSGTNAHVVLEHATSPSPAASLPAASMLLTLSAHSPAALDEMVQNVSLRLADLPAESFGAFCSTSHRLRSTLRYRVGIVADDVIQARTALDELAAGRPLNSAIRGDASVGQGRPIVFLFSGQGAQRLSMARPLYETEPAFRAEIDRCAKILDPVLDIPLHRLLLTDVDPSDLQATRNAQPALFALEWSLSMLWRHWGVTPDIVLGHSLGEYVAACVAGCFSLEDGLRLVAERARLMQSLPSGGAMASVQLAEDETARLLQPYGGKLEIAATNAQRATVVSGDESAIADLLARLARDGIGVRRLDVSHAFHSRHLEPILPALHLAVDRIHFSRPEIEIISNLTGDLAGADDLSNAQYWCRHTREPVRFMQGLNSLLAVKPGAVIEVGPQPVLIGMARQSLGNSDTLFLSSILSDGEDARQMRRSAAALFAAGLPVSPKATFNGPAGNIALPSYPFQNRTIRLEQSRTPLRPAPLAHSGSPRRLALPHSKEMHFELFLSAQDAIVRDHLIFDQIVIPAAWHIAAIATAVGEIAADGAPVDLRDVSFVQAAVVPTEGLLIHISFISDMEGKLRFRLLSRAASASASEEIAWQTHVSGTAMIGTAQEVPELRTGHALNAVDPDTFYNQLEQAGFGLGPEFRWLRSLRVASDFVVADCAASVTGTQSQMTLHPGLLDTAFQLMSEFWQDLEGEAVFIPFRIGRIRLFRSGGTLPTAFVAQAWLEGRREDQDSPPAGVILSTKAGQIIVEARDFVFRTAPRSTLVTAAAGLPARFDAPSSPVDQAPAQMLRSLPIADRHRRLELIVRDLLASELELMDVADITPRGRFFDIGLDSISAIDLSDKIEEKTGLPVDVTLLFDYPTLDALVGYLMTLLASDADKDSVFAPAQVASETHDYASLSEEEAERMLLQKLGRLS